MYRFVPDFSQASEKGAEETWYILVCKKIEKKCKRGYNFGTDYITAHSSARGSECLALQR